MIGIESIETLMRNQRRVLCYVAMRAHAHAAESAIIRCAHACDETIEYRSCLRAWCEKHLPHDGSTYDEEDVNCAMLDMYECIE